MPATPALRVPALPVATEADAAARSRWEARNCASSVSISRRRAWSAELGPDETPFEAGLTYAVKLDKPTDFLGKSALLAARLGWSFWLAAHDRHVVIADRADASAEASRVTRTPAAASRSTRTSSTATGSLGSTTR